MKWKEKKVKKVIAYKIKCILSSKIYKNPFSLVACLPLFLFHSFSFFVTVFTNVQFNYFTTFLGNKMHSVRCIPTHANQTQWKGLRKYFYFLFVFFLQPNCRKSFCITLCARTLTLTKGIQFAQFYGPFHFLSLSLNGYVCWVQ